SAGPLSPSSEHAAAPAPATAAATAAPVADSSATTASRDGIMADLAWRGLVDDATSPVLATHLDSASRVLYAGFDPTAPSLHVGNLLMIVALLRFRAYGHRPLALVGGATGAIGDPSGRSSERPALDAGVLAANKQRIRDQLLGVFRTAEHNMRRHGALPSPAAAVGAAGKDKVEEGGVPAAEEGGVEVVDNLDWYRELSLLDFLSDVGRYARVGAMVAKESVKKRLQSDEGISFTEFAYQLLQAHDFSHLHAARGCTLQLGGSDQWGNITAGIDLIRRKTQTAAAAAAERPKASEPSRKRSTATATAAPPPADPAFGLTLPLITTSTGEKFGKSAGNA
ncbi:tyrosyl-tRNA synthetase, partial [Cladochytrium tenue]